MNNTATRAWLAIVSVACLLAIQGCQNAAEVRRSGGWGIDATLTAHVDSVQRAAYIPMLRAAGIGIVRERGPNPAMVELKAAGLRVVSFVGLEPQPPTQPGDSLSDDLMAVFTAAKAMQQKHGRYVDAWEMVGEADVGYCRDLPDRVAAFQKAVYLGIKAGAESARVPAPLVLMGALALPPGPWLERAARNGLLDYTDAYNFHFYGYAQDLADVTKAHAAFAANWVDSTQRSLVKGGVSGPWIVDSGPVGPSHPLPLWITECGVNAMMPGDFSNPAGRRSQAQFTLATAKEVLRSANVGVFMPFILTHEGDPFALTLDPTRTWPAWDAYAEYANEHSFPARPIAAPPRAPNPIVVQWRPDNQTTTPHKVSGTYRFVEGQPISGVLRIYNLGEAPVRGILEADALKSVGLQSDKLLPTTQSGSDASRRSAFETSPISIGAQEMVEVPIVLTPSTQGYFREFWSLRFRDEHGAESPAYFGLESAPSEDRLKPAAIKLRPVANGQIGHPDLDGNTVTSQSGEWTGINGLVVSVPASNGASSSAGAPSLPSVVQNSTATLTASLSSVSADPDLPPMAIAEVDGLPSRGFLRLQLDRPMDAAFSVRVDLIDRHGQRFTIWENLGASYSGPRDDVWLNLEDFHVYFWGRCSEHPDFRPADIGQIRLRFHLPQLNAPHPVRLSLWQGQPPRPQ